MVVQTTAMRTEIQTEAHILLKLHEAGDHGNIIRILDYGWFPHNYFYIDMDLCDLNLYDYIYGERLVQGDMSFEEVKSPIYIPRDTSLLIKLRNIWAIIGHISDGLKFIHNHGQVHRDLKPRNSNSRPLCCSAECLSSILPKREPMENRRFWTLHRSDLQEAGCHKVCQRYGMLSRTRTPLR